MVDFDYVVCMPADNETAGLFADNVKATCCECGQAIVHRPYVPQNVPKICLPCIGKIAKIRELMDLPNGRPH
jgi:hypothetical protein